MAARVVPAGVSRAEAPRYRTVSVAVLRASTTLGPDGERWRTLRVSRREFLIVIPATDADPR